MPDELNAKNLILVEGIDEINFFKALIRCKNINCEVDIRQYQGKNNLCKKLPILKALSGFKDVEKLIIVMDADNNAGSSFDSIKSTLQKLSLPIPENEGVFSDGEPQIGIFIMPGSIEGKMLEDLCLNSRNDHVLMPCVNAFLECVATKPVTQPKNLSKAKCQAFLSVMPEIASSVGVGAEKGYWNFNHECLNGLVSFLKALETCS